MNKIDFVNKLGLFFGQKYNEEQSEQITKYVIKKNLSANDLDKFYDNIIENFKPFSYKKIPLIFDIAQLFKNIKKENSIFALIDTNLNTTDRMSFDEIVNFINEMKKRDTHAWTNYEVDFLYKWELLWVEAGFCKDYGLDDGERQRHLRYVKEQIIKGFSFESLDDKIKSFI